MDLMTGGLAPEKDLVFPSKPADPKMIESASLWLIEENGAFAFPRIGIEGEAHSWDNRLYHANFALNGGRVLHDTGRGPVPSPIGRDGRPTIFGAGPLTFECIEPFHKWRASFDGTAVDGTVAQQIAQTFDGNNRTEVFFETEMTMVGPAWVHDYSPDKLAGLSEQETSDAATIGIGYRIEQLFTATGTLRLGKESRDFKASGTRIHRQSLRNIATLRGHCWQSATFPDGRGFAVISYPNNGEPGDRPFNDGFVYQDGKKYKARAVKAPWLRRFVESGEDASLELESELGITRISGRTAFTTARPNNKDMGQGISLQQGAVLYNWDGQSAYGMLERSSLPKDMAAV